jgi:hypothetical protein
MSRAVTAEVGNYAKDLRKAFKDKVNGVLEHELSVGDDAFVKAENRLVLPFDPRNQYRYTLAHGVEYKHSKLLTVARMGLLDFWGEYLTAADKDEIVLAEDVDESIDVVGKGDTYDISPKNLGKVKGVQVVPNKVRTVSKAEYEYDFVNVLEDNYSADLRYIAIYTHMKDVGMLVSANLVKTNHHYQKNTNGSFRAMERKRFGREVFDDIERGIVYHEAMHPYVLTSKLLIYNNYLAQYKVSKLDDVYKKLDGVVVKRLPVVPAGAAWLSAGVTILNEMLAIPMIKENIPKEYEESVKEATIVLNQTRDAGVTDNNGVRRFEAMAAFAYGILVEIAATHSAAKAPSLVKIAEQHLGAKLAGGEIGRLVLKGR